MPAISPACEGIIDDDSTQPLSYAPPDPGVRRRKWFRRRIPLALLLLIAVGLFVYRDEIWLRAQMVYWGGRAMHHVTPSGTVLVERDPVRAAALIASNPDYRADSLSKSRVESFYNQTLAFTPPGPAMYFPRTYEAMSAVTWAMELRQRPFQWKVGLMLGEDAIAFMGERSSPAGHRRLIIVPIVSDRSTNTDPTGHFYLAYAELRHPSGIGGSLPESVKVNIRSDVTDERYWDFQPGIADPADRSHISIPFATIKRDPVITGTYDLYLQDDDTIRVIVNETPPAGK